jgi:microsomal epoxide hydrolase
LVGWSQGAQDVAAYIQEFDTDSLDAVVFVDSTVSFGPSEVDVHREFAKIILSNISVYANHPEEFSEGMIRSLFKKPHPELDLPALVKTTLQTPTNTGIAMLVADIFDADRLPAVTKLNKPTLVIASSVSPLLDVRREMAATIPTSKFVVLEVFAKEQWAVFLTREQMVSFWSRSAAQTIPPHTMRTRETTIHRAEAIGDNGLSCAPASRIWATAWSPCSTP